LLLFTVLKKIEKMKILLIGFIAFFGWSTFADYYYVCRIRGFCEESSKIAMFDIKPPVTIPMDTLPLPVARKLVEIPEMEVVYYDFDKAVFNTNSQTENTFAKSIEFLKDNTNANISIIGHADNIGSVKYNQDLGLRRAQNIKDYFEVRGVSANKLFLDSKGETSPEVDNNTIAGRAKNRRTVITINN